MVPAESEPPYTEPTSTPPYDLASDEIFQAEILAGVSRTFALTIPQLPPDLRKAVTNAYLLCRIADTIEDDPGLSAAEKDRFHGQFIAVVADEKPAEPFGREVLPRLSRAMSAEEHELVGNTHRVVAVTRSLRPVQRRALTRCVEVMCEGMREFQRNRRPTGLADLAEMDRYCYYVAGVVGEMLTELFCDYCPELGQCRDQMMELSVSFGQGLQMTNILKDAWDDRSQGACWLPRDVFLDEGFDLSRLEQAADDPGFRAGLVRLIGIAHQHLRDALTYTLLIPAEQTGMRRFCLWAIGMAVLTLHKVHNNHSVATARELKISRRAVRATIAVTNLAVEHDRVLRRMFTWTARNLPYGDPGPSGGTRPSL